jgi:hypothetical protein
LAYVDRRRHVIHFGLALPLAALVLEEGEIREGEIRDRGDPVAVGTPVAQRPPHRSVRER